MVWKFAASATRRVPRVFMFHRFSASAQSGRTHRSEFSKFLDEVTEAFEVCTLSELVLRARSPRRGPKPLAAITIDDGYSDFSEFALPELTSRGLPATLYLSLDFVENRSWLWWDAVRYLIDNVPNGAYWISIDSSDEELKLDSPDSRRAAWSRVGDCLVGRNQLRANVIQRLQEQGQTALPPTPTIDYESLTWEQILNATNNGVEIGCHTLTHAHLPSLPDNALRNELLESKSMLQEKLGCPVNSFAYPNGMPNDHDSRVQQFLIRAGYLSAVLAYQRKFDIRDPYRIGRWTVRTSDRRFKYVLSGASEIKRRMLRESTGQ